MLSKSQTFKSGHASPSSAKNNSSQTVSQVSQKILYRFLYGCGLNHRFFEVLNYDFGGPYLRQWGGLICGNGGAISATMGGPGVLYTQVESKMAREMLRFTIETAVVGREGRICERK